MLYSRELKPSIKKSYQCERRFLAIELNLIRPRIDREKQIPAFDRLIIGHREVEHRPADLGGDRNNISRYICISANDQECRTKLVGEIHQKKP